MKVKDVINIIKDIIKDVIKDFSRVVVYIFRLELYIDFNKSNIMFKHFVNFIIIIIL